MGRICVMECSVHVQEFRNKFVPTCTSRCGGLGTPPISEHIWSTDSNSSCVCSVITQIQCPEDSSPGWLLCCLYICVCVCVCTSTFPERLQPPETGGQWREANMLFNNKSSREGSQTPLSGLCTVHSIIGCQHCWDLEAANMTTGSLGRKTHCQNTGRQNKFKSSSVTHTVILKR